MEQALTLLLSGMITIFVVLSLVVSLGMLLIRITNRLVVEAKVEPAGETTVTEKKEITASQMAAIVAAVEVATGGKARISSVQREKIA